MTDVSEPSDAVTDEARELVIRTQPSGEVAVLDPYVKLLADIAQAAEAKDFWTKRLEQQKAALAVLLGDATQGTLHGEVAVVYEPVDRFNTTAFRRQYPNLYKAYEHVVAKRELDLPLLKSARPDLFAAFQVRPMVVKYKVPGNVGLMVPPGE